MFNDNLKLTSLMNIDVEREDKHLYTHTCSTIYVCACTNTYTLRARSCKKYYFL